MHAYRSYIYTHTYNMLFSVHMYTYIVALRAKLCQIFTLEEVAHIFLPRKDVVNSFVVQVMKSYFVFFLMDNIIVVVGWWVMLYLLW